MSIKAKSWITAARPRTLPLAAASICMGGFLAYFSGAFDWSIFVLTLTTTFLLQILSNLANDYGDFQHGADLHGREGPIRMVHSGAIDPGTMKSAIGVLALFTFIIGAWLLAQSLGFNTQGFYSFLVLGVISIIAAISYTAGSIPYGYRGFGDLAVVLFFGLVAVIGSFYLQTTSFKWDNLLPALSCGLFATAVLNINNIRDIVSDEKAGKISIPVRLGRKGAIRYHLLLLGLALCCSILYVVINYKTPWQWMFMIILPLLVANAKAVQSKSGLQLDPYLKQMAITTLVYVVTFGLGLLIAVTSS